MRPVLSNQSIVTFVMCNVNNFAGSSQKWRFFRSVGGKKEKKRAPQALADGRKGTGKG
jgi:hypothetical protein